MDRQSRLQQRITELISGFPHYVAIGVQQSPFVRRGQWDLHIRTIELRRRLVSLKHTLRDEDFLDLLYATLQAWGIGRRSSRLIDRDTFGKILRDWEDELVLVEEVRIDDADTHQAEHLWHLVEGMGLVENQARIVALTKTLHHLLPDLVVPIDRAYTGTFLGRNPAEFQSSQREIFLEAFGAFSSLARSVDLAAHLGGWNSSITKVIDNAVVGYCVGEDLLKTPTAQPRPAPSGRPRGESWTIGQLESALTDFKEELEAAGLADSSVSTYVGRSEVFVRWLAGEYEPRGARDRSDAAGLLGSTDSTSSSRLLQLIDSLVGEGPIGSLDRGKPNWIIARDEAAVWVETDRSRRKGEGAHAVPIEWIEESYRTLMTSGHLRRYDLGTRARFRSAFILALLSRLENVEAITHPIELRLIDSSTQ